jgi:hypothetical protein
MSEAKPWPRYVCVRCGKDWTTDLENIAGVPSASIDALCECDQLIVAEGAKPGVHLLGGLVAEDESRGLGQPHPFRMSRPARRQSSPAWA